MQLGHSDYLSKLYDPVDLKKTVTRTAKKIKRLQKKLKFDAIAFRGQSGAAVAYPVSMLTGIPLILVRKKESSHGQAIEGPASLVNRYVVLDDFICEGTTVNAIIKAIENKVRSIGDSIECVGIVLYDDYAEDRHCHHDHKDRKILVYSVK